LIEEANRIDTNDQAGDPLIEDISPDGVFSRVNLRQFLILGYPLNSLYQVMKRSANYKGDVEIFHRHWKIFTDLTKEGILDFPTDEIQRIDELIEKEGVKPQHHSEEYRNAYYPAYRVVQRDIFMVEIGVLE
jgi:hypothetical protein